MDACGVEVGCDEAGELRAGGAEVTGADDGVDVGMEVDTTGVGGGGVDWQAASMLVERKMKIKKKRCTLTHFPPTVPGSRQSQVALFLPVARLMVRLLPDVPFEMLLNVWHRCCVFDGEICDIHLDSFPFQ